MPVAFVARREPSLYEEVLQMCKGRIARYTQPKEVRFVAESELPRSTTGEIKRHDLEAVLKS